MSEIEQLITRRNTFVRQADGLRARVAKLEAKIKAADAEIADECTRNGASVEYY